MSKRFSDCRFTHARYEKKHWCRIWATELAEFQELSIWHGDVEWVMRFQHGDDEGARATNYSAHWFSIWLVKIKPRDMAYVVSMWVPLLKFKIINVDWLINTTKMTRDKAELSLLDMRNQCTQFSMSAGTKSQNPIFGTWMSDMVWSI